MLFMQQPLLRPTALLVAGSLRGGRVSDAGSGGGAGAYAVLGLVHVGAERFRGPREAAGSQQQLPVGRQRKRAAKVFARALRGDVLVIGAHHRRLRRHAHTIGALHLGSAQ